MNDDACLPLIRSSDTPDHLAKASKHFLHRQAKRIKGTCIGVVRVNSQRSVVPRSKQVVPLCPFASRSEPRVPIVIPDSHKRTETINHHQQKNGRGAHRG
jgi:hypothetical protein